MNRKVSETKTSNGIKIKYLFNQNRKQINPNSLEDLDVCHYSIPNVQEFGKGVIENGTDIESNKFLIEHEQLLVSKLNPRKQTVCLSHPEETVTVCSTEFISLYPKEKNVDLNYSRYVFMMSETTELLDSMVESVTRSHQRIQPEKFENLYFPLPPLDEQKLISRYLDKKTEQIDSLIEKIQKKIELLKEQRTSLINQCVTKGLDPNVEMKDSGVEWIGEIPKHWDLKSLKYLVSYNQETLSENTEPDYEFNYIEIGDVNYVEGISINDKTSFSESPSRARRVVRPNDVIVSTVRTYLRSIGVVPNLDNVICSTGFCVLRDNTGLVDQRFLSYSVRSEWFVSEVISNSYGVSYPAINSSELVDIGIVIPSMDEQKKIVNFIDLNIKKIDHEIQHEERRNTLIKEFRQSLISSVVNGKVRVTEDMI